MMRVLLSFMTVSLAIGVGLLSGCGSSGNPPAAVASTPADVYVAGVVYTPQGGGATYWKNGNPVSLSGFSLGSSANAIAVSGNDVYVAGVGSNGGQDIAAYWKNGALVTLTAGTGRGFANAIFVSNGDVYVAGAESSASGNSQVAKYWKNGVPVSLAQTASDGMANAIFVSGTDVYVAGYVSQTSQTALNSTFTTQVATLWKNGSAVSLTDGLHTSEALSLFVSGSDVYVAGYSAHTVQGSDNTATYWKNSSPITLKDATDSFADSIVVSGQDVFVAGGDDAKTAGYWKNGVQTILPGGTVANQIAVSGSDVYLAGNNFPSSPIGPSGTSGTADGASGGGIGATYWKNATPLSLAPDAYGSTASAIAVNSANPN